MIRNKFGIGTNGWARTTDSTVLTQVMERYNSNSSMIPIFKTNFMLVTELGLASGMIIGLTQPVSTLSDRVFQPLPQTRLSHLFFSPSLQIGFHFRRALREEDATSLLLFWIVFQLGPLMTVIDPRSFFHGPVQCPLLVSSLELL